MQKHLFLCTLLILSPAVLASMRLQEKTYGATKNGSVYVQGPIEMFKGGSWKALCSSIVSNQNADVVCGMLGYPPGEQDVQPNGQTPPSHFNKLIQLKSKQCSGHKSNIVLCPFCSKENDNSFAVGVQCLTGTKGPLTTPRMAMSSTPNNHNNRKKESEKRGKNEVAIIVLAVLFGIVILASSLLFCCFGPNIWRLYCSEVPTVTYRNNRVHYQADSSTVQSHDVDVNAIG